jgi:hypothetical protein
MKHLLVVLIVACLCLPATALAKGASEATLEGAGIGAIALTGEGQSGGMQLSALADQSGLYLAMFREPQLPDRVLASRPRGDLGPKYTITWTMPTSATDEMKIFQEVYPYAKPAPVTYMRPGQKVFDSETRGGWFQADSRLKETLVAAGLPARAPESSSGESSFRIDLVGLLAGALLLATGATFFVRRRMRPAQAT